MIRLRIAVAEDEGDVQDYYRTILPVLGHDVVAVVGTGGELVEACTAHAPDLVVTDVKMPDMDGLEAMRRVYLRDPVPVVFVTGHHESRMMARAREEFVQSYLVKPVRREHLDAAIATAWRRFAEFRQVRDEAGAGADPFEGWRKVNAAKDLLVVRGAATEEAAFQTLQRDAAARSLTLTQSASDVLRTAGGRAT